MNTIVLMGRLARDPETKLHLRKRDKPKYLGFHW